MYFLNINNFLKAMLTSIEVRLEGNFFYLIRGISIKHPTENNIPNGEIMIMRTVSLRSET